MRVTRMIVAACTCRGLAELVNMEIAVRAGGPAPQHLTPGGMAIELIEEPARRWQARLEFGEGQ